MITKFSDEDQYRKTGEDQDKRIPEYLIELGKLCWRVVIREADEPQLCEIQYDKMEEKYNQ